MKWKPVLMPRKIEVDSSSDEANFGRFVIEPLERGFGTTLGNAIRRTLLSLLQGAAVTAIKIDGVLHEMSTHPGVVEDMTDVVLNVKRLASEVQRPPEAAFARPGAAAHTAPAGNGATTDRELVDTVVRRVLAALDSGGA